MTWRKRVITPIPGTKQNKNEKEKMGSTGECRAQQRMPDPTDLFIWDYGVTEILSDIRMNYGVSMHVCLYS